MVYSAEPVCDDSSAAIALELHVIIIETSYYRTPQGIVGYGFVCMRLLT